VPGGSTVGGLIMAVHVDLLGPAQISYKICFKNDATNVEINDRIKILLGLNIGTH
jgi:hypothetical protein